jgi:hypothetical protein
MERLLPDEELQEPALNCPVCEENTLKEVVWRQLSVKTGMAREQFEVEWAKIQKKEPHA